MTFIKKVLQSEIQVCEAEQVKTLHTHKIIELQSNLQDKSDCSSRQSAHLGQLQGWAFSNVAHRRQLQGCPTRRVARLGQPEAGRWGEDVTSGNLVAGRQGEEVPQVISTAIRA